jgi:hypothetical protein
MRQLALWRRVVFVDWHGVLSRDPFWTSIRESAIHPLRAQLEAGLAGIFARESATANEWMKGLLSSDQIIDTMGIQLDRRFRDDFLSRRLDVDCARMKVNAELFEVLRKIKAQASVVMATDNMDCFARTFDQVRTRGRRPTPESETLADWAVICDDMPDMSPACRTRAWARPSSTSSPTTRRANGSQWTSRWTIVHRVTQFAQNLAADREDGCDGDDGRRADP